MLPLLFRDEQNLGLNHRTFDESVSVRPNNAVGLRLDEVLLYVERGPRAEQRRKLSWRGEAGDIASFETSGALDDVRDETIVNSA
jgi:hypothetical protein